MSISSDEINFLIYRYLQENGFSHTAFAFAHESLVVRSSVAQVELPAGALITFLQKGLEYVGIEEHINEDGSIREFDGNYSLLSPFICEAIGVKEERRYRSKMQHTDSRQTDTNVALSADATKTRDEGLPVKPEGSGTGSEEMAVLETDVEPATSLILEQGFKSIELKTHAGKEVYISSWNPTKNQVVSGSSDGTCRMWGLDSIPWDQSTVDTVSVGMTVLPHYKEQGENYKDVTSVQWSPLGDILATGCYDGVIRLWNNDGSLKSVLDKHDGPVFALRWSRDGRFLLTGGNDHKTIIWDPQTGNVVKTYFLHSAPILDVDWSEGDMFATASADRVIHVCKVGVPGNAALVAFRGHSNEINSVCWSPDGRLVASSSDDATAKVWSVDKGLLHDMRGHVKEVFSACWTVMSAGTTNAVPLLCTASFDGTVKVWSPESGNLVHNLKRSMQPCYSIAANPEGTILAVGSLKGYVTLWNLKDGSLLREFKEPGNTFNVSWSHDGKMLCSCFSKGIVHVMRTDDIIIA